MASSRPSYAPNSPLTALPPTKRALMRVRRRARRHWPVQRLLDDREEMLTVLAALERARAKAVTRLKQRAMEKPAARDVIENTSRQVQDGLERGAEGVRHRLLLSDSILSNRGVRPWEDPKGEGGRCRSI